MDLKQYVLLAKKKGAVHAVLINSREVVLDPRTMLKCRFGCTGWGHNWTCPSAPGAITTWEFAEVIKHYKKALLIHTDSKHLSQAISYKIEQQAYVDGNYFAFSFSDCTICKDCRYPKPCRAPKKARPAMQAVGIDVFATARKQGLPIKTLKDKSEQANWYSLVLIN
jgi:predicted metal-binding protein